MIAHTRHIVKCGERQHLKPAQLVAFARLYGYCTRAGYLLCSPYLRQCECRYSTIYHVERIFGVVVMSVAYQASGNFPQVVVKSLLYLAEWYAGFDYQSLLPIIKYVAISTAA